jgi:hypothetical protein
MLIAANLLLNYGAETETFDSGDIIFNEGKLPNSITRYSPEGLS